MDNYLKIEDMIKTKKFKKIKKQMKEKLLKYFKDKNNREILLKIFTEDIIEKLINQIGVKDKEAKEEKPKKTSIKIPDKIECLEKKPNNNNNNNNIINEKQLSEKANKEQLLSNDKTNLTTATTTTTTTITTTASKKVENPSKEVLMPTTNIEQTTKMATTATTEQTTNVGTVTQNKVKSEKEVEKNHEYIKKITFHTSKKDQKTIIIYDNIYLENGSQISFEDLKKKYEDNSNNKITDENSIKQWDYCVKFEKELIEQFEREYCLIIQLEFLKEIINNNTDPNIDNITCKITFFEPKNNKKKPYEDDNILIYGIDSKRQGFHNMIIDINKSSYKNIKYIPPQNKNIEHNNNNNSINNDNNVKDISTPVNLQFINVQFQKEANKFEVIKLINIMGNHNKAVEHITELSCGYYVSAGCEKEIILYDVYFCQIKKIILNDWVFSIREIISEKYKEKIQILCCTNKELDLITIDKETLIYKIQPYELPKKTFSNFLEMKPNNFIVLGKNYCSYFTEFFNDKNPIKDNKIINKTYKGALKITDNIAVLTSNSIMPEGEDQLIIFNTNNKKKSISLTIEGYSFTNSVNGLAIIPRKEENNDNKIVIATCKKYKKDQSNGIVLVNPQIGNYKRVNDEFYPLGNFEPNCICPIYNIDNKNNNYDNINEEYRNNISITDTNYFFVGGFDNEKKEGKIKLFKVLFDKKENKAYNTKIKFIQDIVLEDDNEYFDGPISCILQSKITGNILITCYNGKVYLFTPPNLEYYLKLDIDR